MRFFIQAGSHRFFSVREIEQRALDQGDLMVGALMERIFPVLTERMIFCWEYLERPLWYSESGIVIEDAMALCDDIFQNPVGCKSIAWVLQGLESVWNVSWNEETVSVQSTFEDVYGTGLETLLAKNPSFEMGRIEFLAEWRMPFVKILEAIQGSGVDPSDITDLDVLKRLVADIPMSGLLYRQAEPTRADQAP